MCLNPDCLLAPSQARSGYQNGEQPAQKSQGMGLIHREAFHPTEEEVLPQIPRVNSWPTLCFPGQLAAASYFPGEGLCPFPLAHKTLLAFLVIALLEEPRQFV